MQDRPTQAEGLPDLHRRQMGRCRVRQDVPDLRSLHRRALGADPRVRQGRCRPRRGGGRARLRERAVAADDADRARQGHAPHRPADREARRAPGPDRGARQRQADLRDGGADQVHAGVVLLLRRAGGQNPRRGGAGRPAGPLQLHPARAGRRVRVHHAVELAADADGVEAGAGAGGRLHRGDQAVGVHLRLAAGVHEAGDRGGGLAARRRQCRDRLRRGRRRAAGDASQGRQGRLHRRHGDGRARQRAGGQDPSRRCRWSSAASRPTSCSTTASSTMR